MNRHVELNSVPKYFSQNLISIFKQLPANDLRRQKTSAKKRQYLRKYLTYDGLIDWSLKQALLAWERRNWNDLRKLVCDTNTKPRHWPEKIKEELVLLRETELRDSQPFATLCECESSLLRDGCPFNLQIPDINGSSRPGTDDSVSNGLLDETLAQTQSTARLVRTPDITGTSDPVIGNSEFSSLRRKVSASVAQSTTDFPNLEGHETATRDNLQGKKMLVILFTLF
jgi:hypothetical protein